MPSCRVSRRTQAQAEDRRAARSSSTFATPPEVEQSGKVAGAVHIPRGMLEFRADPESPYYDKSFAKDKTVIVYCAAGGRAALSGQALKEMGYDEVYNLGGFGDWAESGGAVDKP